MKSKKVFKRARKLGIIEEAQTERIIGQIIELIIFGNSESYTLEGDIYFEEKRVGDSNRSHRNLQSLSK
ncbi:1710_t:CDS:2 [Funneliformis geosporum]|uniref:1710_t:CDS:1 n=1 Tax=Funneliformis geosporum TaxID=1117311 RepID=A0A9W4T4D5_9GLOM|nr:1710_t:CDS:2 [Funneliformis geosporum]